MTIERNTKQEGERMKKHFTRTEILKAIDEEIRIYRDDVISVNMAQNLSAEEAAILLREFRSGMSALRFLRRKFEQEEISHVRR